MRKILPILGLSLLLISEVVASAREPVSYKKLASSEFRPITPTTVPVIPTVIPRIIIETNKGITRTHPKIIVVDPKPGVIVKSTPRPKKIVTTKKSVTRINTSHSVKGVASWYCKAGVSVCHYAYPPGSMVAAACGKLRRAMGSHWRNKNVVVQGNGRTVHVKLVDWCGSTTKLIDLYWEPMRRLGGTGTLPVRVSW